MHILEISKSSSAKTEFSFFSVFFRRFSVFSFFSIPTSVSVSVFYNIAISVSVFGYRLGSSNHAGNAAKTCSACIFVFCRLVHVKWEINTDCIAYFLGNISAKNYRNQLMYVALTRYFAVLCLVWA